MNSRGYVHIYCGDGKGKTTAAVGLAVRSAGAERNVLFCQIFKDGTSSELNVLRTIPRVKIYVCSHRFGLYQRMDNETRLKAAAAYSELFYHVIRDAYVQTELLILDEIISACNRGVVQEQALLEFLLNKPEYLEVVLTGRTPSNQLLQIADYVTEMKKVRHPYDGGVGARKGIEY